MADFWLFFVMFNCGFVIFKCGILGQVWYLIVSIPDVCHLFYFAGRTYHIVGNLMPRLISLTFESNVSIYV